MLNMSIVALNTELLAAAVSIGFCPTFLCKSLHNIYGVAANLFEESSVYY